MELNINTVSRARLTSRIIFETSHFIFSAFSRGIFVSLDEAQEHTRKALRETGKIFPRLPEKDPPNRFYCISERGDELLEIPFQVRQAGEELLFIVKTVYRITKEKRRMRNECLNI